MQPTRLAVVLTTSVSLIIAACLNLQLSQAKEWHQNRRNLFDPIYAYDDVDAHYVSPSLPSSSSSSSALSPSSLTSGPSTSSIPSGITSVDRNDATNQLKILLSQISDDNDSLHRVTLKDIELATTSSGNGSGGGRRTTLPATELNSTTLKEARQLSDNFDLPPRSGLEEAQFRGPNRPIERANEEPAHHWSGLENYYKKLRQAADSRTYQFQAPTAYQVPTPDRLPYEIIMQQLQQQEEEEAGDSYGSYKQFGSYLPGNVALPNRHPVAKLNPAFLLPIVGGRANNQRPPIGPADSNDYSFTVDHNSAPAISKTGGIGAGSILWPGPQATDSTASAAGGLPGQLSGSSSSSSSSSASELPLASSTMGEDGKVRNLDWRKLPELLLIQQQQQRVRHQQETFGSWYDQRRSKELLQQEAFCGPRNYIKLNAPGTKGGLDKKSVQTQLDRLQQAQLDGSLANRLDDAPARIVPHSPNNYPSHVGLYNGSVNDDNFICAATWIHESFALTLASCVNSIDPKRIIFRLGEWNLNRNQSSSSSSSSSMTPVRPEKTLIMGQVDQVHIFPKFRNNSVEHNLALVHFARPIEFLELAYVCPACQMQTRSSIRASSCWAPSRNVGLIEYFDAEGEGETKERKSISMVDLPVKLIAHDDAECERQTRVEFFNFQHPNYICSGDYKKSISRARLNNSDTFGSGIYCNEDGNLSLVSIVHPVHPNSSSAFGYMDLSYYRPWMHNIMFGRNY